MSCYGAFTMTEPRPMEWGTVRNGIGLGLDLCFCAVCTVPHTEAMN